MDWSASTLWWLAAGVLVAAELATGTFYLLMLAVGAGTAAVAAHLRLPFAGQLVAAALVGGGAVAVWYLKRSRMVSAPAGANRDVNLDIGGRVQVESWNAQGVTRVQHRGANWSARFTGPGVPAAGTHVIRAIEGSELLLERVPH